MIRRQRSQAGSGMPFLAGAAPPKPRKYRNEVCEADGHRFASKKERNRYFELKIKLALGEIRALELQPRYPLVVNGVKVATYVADFVYADAVSGVIVVEDVKSPASAKIPTYRLKKRLLAALYGHEVREVY